MQAQSTVRKSAHRFAFQRPTFLVFLSACLVFALALSAAPPARAASSQKIDIGKWRRLDTESFTVYTNGDRKEAERWVRELEGFSKVLHVLFPGLNPEPLRPLRLYLFAKNRSFNQYVADGSRLAGFFTRRPRMSLMVVDGSGFSPAPTLYHEYTHYVLRNNLPYLPQWIDEGLAEYFETFTIERNKARFGHVHRGWSRHLQSSNWMPIEEVLEVTTRGEAYRDPVKTLDFRAQAWALVDFLFEREEGRREQTLRLFQLLDSGTTSADALQQAFGTSLAEIQSKLKKNVMFADRKIQVLDLKMLPASRDIEVHDLDHDEALVRLGELLMVGGEDEQAKARQYFDNVLSRRPDHAQALVGKGILQLNADDPESALATLGQALKIAPTAGAHFYAGNAYLRQFEAQDGTIPGFGQSTSPLIAKARESFKKALELDPRMTDAYNLVGHTYLYDAGSPQPGITLTETVLAKVPNIVLALTLIELHSRKGDQTSAYRVRDTQLERMVASQSHQSVDWVDNALVVADLILADAWRLQGREQEARDLVKDLVDKVDDEEIAQRIAEWRRNHDPSEAAPPAPSTPPATGGSGSSPDPSSDLSPDRP